MNLSSRHEQPLDFGSAWPSDGSKCVYRRVEAGSTASRSRFCLRERGLASECEALSASRRRRPIRSRAQVANPVGGTDGRGIRSSRQYFRTLRSCPVRRTHRGELASHRHPPSRSKAEVTNPVGGKGGRDSGSASSEVGSMQPWNCSREAQIAEIRPISGLEPRSRVPNLADSGPSDECLSDEAEVTPSHLTHPQRLRRGTRGGELSLHLPRQEAAGSRGLLRSSCRTE